MAVFTAVQVAALQSAVDLLTKGTAVEFPLSQDVVDRLFPLLQGTYVGTGVAALAAQVANSGLLNLDKNPYVDLRDNPVTSLIALVWVGGIHKLSTAEQQKLADGIGLMLKTQARELPFAEDVIQRIEPVAVSSGFVTSTEKFRQDIRDVPVSTMLKWAIQLGS